MLNHEFNRLARFVDSAEPSYTKHRPKTQEVFFDWTEKEVAEALQSADPKYFVKALQEFGQGKSGMVMNYKKLTKAINAKEFPQPLLQKGWIYVREKNDKSKSG